MIDKPYKWQYVKNGHKDRLYKIYVHMCRRCYYEKYEFYHRYDVIASCMQEGLLWDYGQGKDLYFWHISNLKIYDEPKELDELRKPIECHRGIARENCKGCWDCEITRPPQSWCYVEEG